LATAALAAATILVCSIALHAQATERRLYVSVVNEAGAPVTDLGPSDLVVREDNVAREVLRVEPAQTPMQIAVMVDNSQAARDFIRDIRVGVEAFVNDMMNGTRHQLSIVAVGERPTILAEFTGDRAQVLKGVTRIFEQRQSANYLLNGLMEVSRGFARREAERPVIVAVTTEGPEYSSRYWEDVLRPVRNASAALHVIVLGSPSNDISEDARNRSAVLDQGPELTGGLRESLLVGSALPGALKRLAAELRSQLLVTYARPPALIPPERVTVTTTRPGLTARGTPAREPSVRRRS
jgi:hypothetical protein